MTSRPETRVTPFEQAFRKAQYEQTFHRAQYATIRDELEAAVLNIIAAGVPADKIVTRIRVPFGYEIGFKL